VVTELDSPTMTKTLTVGIVIPCHNYGHFLSDAIRSVLSQTRIPDTVLVVDDGSTDDTRQVVESFGERVGYLRIDLGSPSAARNAGARALRTDLVVFLDADDKIDPAFVARTMAELPDDWSNFFVYSYFRRFGNVDAVDIVPAYDRVELARENYIGPTTLLPRAKVAQIGYDESLRTGLEDWDLYLTFAEHGIAGILVEEPLFLYRIHGDGITWRLRRRPLHLAVLRTRLLVKHRRLYSPSRAGSRLRSILAMSVTDTEERYQLRRRSKKIWQIGKDLVRRG
jgi:glycosyltransferase involved in cell wall biosynthesis